MFIDFTKAFDTVGRDGIWELLKKYRCPAYFVSMLKQLHTDMNGMVSYGSELSSPFKITNGVKQGCLLTPTLSPSSCLQLCLKRLLIFLTPVLCWVFVGMVVYLNSSDWKQRLKFHCSLSVRSCMLMTVPFSPIHTSIPTILPTISLLPASCMVSLLI